MPARAPRLILQAQYSPLPVFAFRYDPVALEPASDVDPYVNRLLIAARPALPLEASVSARASTPWPLPNSDAAAEMTTGQTAWSSTCVRPGRGSSSACCSVAAKALVCSVRRMRNSPHHLSCGPVLALPVIRHLPQQIVFGPGQVDHFHDHLRPRTQCTRESWSGEPKRLSRGGGSASGIFGTCSGASGHGLSSCFDTYWPSKICGFRHWVCPRRVVTFLPVQSFRLGRPGRAAKLHAAQPASGQHAIRMQAATMPS